MLTFEKYFDLGRPPTRIRPHEKSLYFSTWVSPVTTRPLLKQKSLYFFTFSFFHLGRSSIIMRPSMRNPCIFQKKKEKSLFVFFTIEKVAWNNETNCEIPCILSSGKSLRTMRPLASFLVFYHRVGRLEQ